MCDREHFPSLRCLRLAFGRLMAVPYFRVVGCVSPPRLVARWRINASPIGRYPCEVPALWPLVSFLMLLHFLAAHTPFAVQRHTPAVLKPVDMCLPGVLRECTHKVEGPLASPLTSLRGACGPEASTSHGGATSGLKSGARPLKTLRIDCDLGRTGP